MDTTQPRKFMFDHSFDGTVSANNPARRVPVTLKPEQVDALKQEAFDAGFAAGKQAGADEHALYVKASLTQLEKQLGDLMDNIQIHHQERDAQMRQAVLAVAHKLLPDFMAKHGINEIQAMLAGVIGEMAHEPRLVVRVNETEFDTLNSRIHEITAHKAFAGKVVVLADPEMAAGNCRAEWADGGMERNVNATWQAIEQVVAPQDAPNVNPSPAHKGDAQ